MITFGFCASFSFVVALSVVDFMCSWEKCAHRDERSEDESVIHQCVASWRHRQCFDRATMKRKVSFTSRIGKSISAHLETTITITTVHSHRYDNGTKSNDDDKPNSLLASCDKDELELLSGKCFVGGEAAIKLHFNFKLIVNNFEKETLRLVFTTLEMFACIQQTQLLLLLSVC